MPPTKRQTWDTIVIGSGVGGLSAAVACARAGQRVLVLEAREVPGGSLRSMSIDGARVSPGLHAVGGLGHGGALRRSLEGLGVTQDGLSFTELAANVEHVDLAGERFDLPSRRDRLVEHLAERFPHERDGLRAYFVTLSRLRDELEATRGSVGLAATLALPFKAPTLVRWGLSTQGALLDAFIRDPDLRDLLAATNGVHGLAPSHVTAVAHASLVDHFGDGSFYPRGGAKAIPMAMLRQLRRRGGQLRLCAAAKRILVERGRAAGVELASGERLYARSILSDVDRRTTFGELLPLLHGKRERVLARRPRPTPSAFALFATVDIDLRARGYDSGNYWLYRERDVEAFYRKSERELPRGDVDGLFLSITSLKDPDPRRGKEHTIEMFTVGPRGALPPHDHRLGDAMLAAADRIVPGLREHLTFRSAVTPISNAFGARRSPWQLRSLLAESARTSVDGLFVCGGAAIEHGVLGAIRSGLEAARGALGVNRALDLLGPADGSLRVLAADDPSLSKKPAIDRVPEAGAANDSAELEDVA